MARTDLPLVVKANATSTRAVTASDFGCLLTNRGGGACTFTLPDPTATPAGVWVQFQSVAAGNFVIATTANLMVAFNDLEATSIAFSDDNKEIGNAAWLVCDGYKWLAFVQKANEATVVTVA